MCSEEDYRNFSLVKSLQNKWNTFADTLTQQQMKNPFSDRYIDSNRKKWVKGSSEYGKPVGKTAERAKKANKHIDREIRNLIEIIFRCGWQSKDGGIFIDFGQLFQTYTRISTNLVGYLIRARRRELVDFPGEMLWQRRDDDVLIYLKEKAYQLIEAN